MTEQMEQLSGANEQPLQAEIARLNKMIQALMNRAERNASLQGSDFNLFQTAITLEDQVRRRTGELEAALQENQKITRALRESLMPSSLDLAMRTLSEDMDLEKSGQKDMIPLSRTLQLEMTRKDGTVWTESRYSFFRDEDQRLMVFWV